MTVYLVWRHRILRIASSAQKKERTSIERIGKMEAAARDPLNFEPFDPTFSKTVGEGYVVEGGKGRVDTGMRGRTKRKVGWKPLEIESIKPRATPPSPSLHRWLDRWKDSPPKWRKSTFNRFRSGLIFDKIRYARFEEFELRIIYSRSKRSVTRFSERIEINFPWI